jgi:hypothetical protein
MRSVEKDIFPPLIEVIACNAGLLLMWREGVARQTFPERLLKSPQAEGLRALSASLLQTQIKSGL